MAPRWCLGLAALLVACTGGGGSLSSENQTQDTAPNSLERARTSAEHPSTTNAPTSKTNESNNGSESTPSAGGFNCSGTYACTISIGGKSGTTKVRLAGSANNCSVDGSGLNPDGTITKNGVVVATWTPNPGGGFSYSAESASSNRDGVRTTAIAYTANCIKISDATTKGDDDDDDDDSPTVDAGKR